MSKIRKTIGLDKTGIESLSLPEKDKQFFRELFGFIERMHRDIRENIESGVLTTNWRVKQVGANLEFQKDGVKKGAITDP